MDCESFYNLCGLKVSISVKPVDKFAIAAEKNVIAEEAEEINKEYLKLKTIGGELREG